MKNNNQKQPVIYTIIGMLIVIAIVLLISIFVYAKYQNDLKKDIEKEKEIANKIIDSVESELGERMNSNITYVAPITCEINKDGNICYSKENDDSYNINVDEKKKPTGGIIKFTSSGISNTSTVVFKNRSYTLQIDGTFELN